MIKTFDEFVSDQYQESIEEGKLKNIVLAVSLASNVMLGSNYLKNKSHDNDLNIDKTEYQVTQQKEPEQEEKKDTIVGVKNYFPSDDIITFIKNAEGWHEGWKDDGKGNPTTGWGFKATKELKRQYPSGMTKKQADDYLVKVAIPERVKDFKKSVPNIEQYSQRQLDALFDLFYNVGIGTFTKGSPSLQLALKQKDYDRIVKEMDHDYDNPKLPGIKIRRDFERELFMQDVKELI